MAYPNVAWWNALQDGSEVDVDNKTYKLSIVPCGELIMPSGRLVACDPFAGLTKEQNVFVQLPAGRYPVTATLADVSGMYDGSHMREAYLTLLLDKDASEVRRRIITPLLGEEEPTHEMENDGSYHGFPVDAGTACFVDAEAVRTCMPDEQTWYEGLFDNDSPDSWFNAMDDAGRIREGIANIKLPMAENGENIILCHSGWGDGHFPVIGGYNSNDKLVRVHIDFFVVFIDNDT